MISKRRTETIFGLKRCPMVSQPSASPTSVTGGRKRPGVKLAGGIKTVDEIGQVPPPRCRFPPCAVPARQSTQRPPEASAIVTQQPYVPAWPVRIRLDASYAPDQRLCGQETVVVVLHYP